MPIRSPVGFMTLAALLLAAPPGAVAQQGQAPGASAGRPGNFCVGAPALPVLAAEPAWRGDKQQGRGDGRIPPDRHATSEMAMAAPPPPPPPPPAPPPPLPPPPNAAPSDGGARTEGIVPGSSADYAAAPAERGRIAPSPSTSPSRPGPAPQAGVLTAGEHDDLLNPELYARYVRTSNLGQSIPDLPTLDTRAVLTVEVKDASGRPMPFARVRLTCSDGNSLSVPTLADGRAVFFPGIDRLSPTVQVSASMGDHVLGSARTVQIVSDAGGQLVTITGDVAAQAPRKLDLMLVVDTTGSMSDELRFLQAELQSVIASLVRRHSELDVRVGFVFYRDEGDDYVTHTVGFDGRMERAQGALARQYATGGGDYPEAMDQAMIRAVGQQWRGDAVKSLLLVADAPPHDDKVARTWDAARVARGKRIQITPVAASGVADTAEYAMRAMAALTQSRYLFLTDDSGVGNPHAPPAIDCYLVTRLDALLRRVIDSQISGRRIEPDQGEVIRTVGDYDNGRCVLPRDFAEN